jgi:cytochrome P450
MLGAMSGIPFAPGPRPLHMLRWWLRPLPFMERGAAELGDLFQFHIRGLGDIVLVRSPEHIRQIFAADPAVLAAGEANRILLPVLGRHSMLLLDRQEHLRQRRLLMPPFMGERMASYADTVQQCTVRALRPLPFDRAFRLQPIMQAITLDVILRAIFGLGDSPEDAGIFAALTRAFQVPIPFLALVPAFQFDVPLSPYRRLKREVGGVEQIIDRLIARRRSDPAASNRTDILSLLLAARDEDGQPMADEEIRDELKTLVAAGHETTASALAWTFDRILAEPHVLEKVLSEVKEATAQGSTAAGLAKLEYLDAVIKEALRLRPIIPIVARVVKAPFELGGHVIPPGTVLAPCIYLAQRRPESFPEPERFFPERWIGKKVDPNTWLPFGGGGRRCIGMGFALLEMKIVLATVLSRVRLRAASPEQERPVRRGITLIPEHGTRVLLSPLAEAA